VREEEQKRILEEWISRYKALIFKVVRTYAVTAMDQDDLFQEVIIQVWNSIPAFRNESSPSTWLYRISLNTAIKWARKERRQYKPESLDDALQNIIHASDIPMDERLVWLYEEIRTLDEIDRSVTLLMLDGFSYKEIAGMLGISESNVGVKINRIKKHLISQSQKNNLHGI
jgi:RNA polymerase sigma-70 factor (ECF subfamily)